MWTRIGPLFAPSQLDLNVMSVVMENRSILIALNPTVAIEKNLNSAVNKGFPVRETMIVSGVYKTLRRTDQRYNLSLSHAGTDLRKSIHGHAVWRKERIQTQRHAGGNQRQDRCKNDHDYRSRYIKPTA
jgi:hypothetical protein